MNAIDDLDTLAERVGQGDFRAKTRLETELKPRLQWMVRHVIERGIAYTKLDRRILAAARRLAPRLMPRASDPRMIRIAYSLCQLVVEDIWPGNTAGPWETMVS